MEKVSRVESLQEIIAEMSDGEENPATTRSQPLLLPTHAATEIHSAQDAAGLSETRHKQREHCAGSPSRRGRCESDRGAPEIDHREVSRWENSSTPALSVSALAFCGIVRQAAAIGPP